MKSPATTSVNHFEPLYIGMNQHRRSSDSFNVHTRIEDRKLRNIVDYDLVEPVTPPPALIEHVVPRDDILFIIGGSRNTTMTVMSS